MAMARKTLAFARAVLSEEYADKAGREAYLAGFQAALAFILDRTGKVPKTHSGTRSEFSRLARDEPRFAREQLAFLGWTYGLKATADYGAEQPVSLGDAERAICEAANLIEVVAALLPGAGPGLNSG
jgi:uncharacterized protein (UPF0332 family)